MLAGTIDLLVNLIIRVFRKMNTMLLLLAFIAIVTALPVRPQAAADIVASATNNTVTTVHYTT